jgi:hypothetical protein
MNGNAGPRKGDAAVAGSGVAGSAPAGILS